MYLNIYASLREQKSYRGSFHKYRLLPAVVFILP